MNNKENSTENSVQKSDVALREEAVQSFWAEHDIFKKSIETPAGQEPVGDFVFYDGPPFATGTPHYGHILAGVIKDSIPRFWTMNGYRVRRKWGWDCHGLPLENLIEKKLGLATKRDIEEYGVKNFNEAARSTVMEYADYWAKVVPRMGRWADMNDDYKTMDATYTESVWWVFSELNKKGLVFEGFKSMHLCPRCGTTLSNFEVNQGYKDIKDIAITVKLPLLDEEGVVTDTSLLVWTTTPWTMPGNMAAAVHKDHTYTKVKLWTSDVHKSDVSEFEVVILAKERLVQLCDVEYEIIDEFKGADLVGKKYEPPFDYWKDQEFEGKENAWTIYHADYVELGSEGTGAVHLAPAYGEEDMALAKEKGVPIVHHVDANGHFMPHITDFVGQLVKPKDDDDAGVTHLDADIEIVKALKERGRLFKKENITHSYPHCWRCDTPLLNYATTSWFVDVPAIKDKLVEENNKVHWVPEYVGNARFGKWLEGARDWAVSRQRYWGAPLPIWRNPETKEYKVFGSLNELQEHAPKSGNTFTLMRHGESTKNVQDLVTDEFNAPYPLTDVGREQVKKSATELKGKVDYIYVSPVLRAQETASILAAELGLDDSQVITDNRIKETDHGVYEGKLFSDFVEEYPRDLDRFKEGPEDGENWSEIKKRTGDFIYDIDKKYSDKKILVISHGVPLMLLRAVIAGLTPEAILKNWDDLYPTDKGVPIEGNFMPMPHNDNYELDFHRPYIDDFEVFDTDGTKLERVPDVFDCWFESGSMPYGQHHYPFENADSFEIEHFPANFIAEGLDQTRGWFYSLIVLGTALFGKSPYENVIVNGLVLAEDGKKMSKSLQNYPDPMLVADTAGADAMRHYLLSSPVIRGEDLNFTEKGVLELQRKNIGRLNNVLTMYQTYEEEGVESLCDSTNVLDRWIVARLNELIAESTAGYKAYELDKAARPITDFIDDLSVWYLRRSRDRLKSEDQPDKKLALGTLRYVLHQLSLVMAPAMPFYAEYLFQAVKAEGEAESVHLMKWPEGGKIELDVLEVMITTRDLVTAALEVRSKSGVKTRQPLSTLTVKGESDVLSEDYLELVKDEVNVKAVEFNKNLSVEVELDTVITPELQAEGDAREFIRAVQDMRKTAGLQPSDRITLSVQASDGGEAIVKNFQTEIQKVVGADEVVFGDTEGAELTAGEHSFTVSIKQN